MQFTTCTLAAFAISLLSTTHAVITGISSPSVLIPGANFTLSLLTSDAQQKAANVAVAFGIATGPGYFGTLGSTLLGQEILGDANSNIIRPISFTYTLSEDTPAGLSTITAAVFSLLGAENEYSIATYNVTMNIAASFDTVDPATVSTASSPPDQATQSAAVVPNQINTRPTDSSSAASSAASSSTHASGARGAAALFPMGNFFGF